MKQNNLKRAFTKPFLFIIAIALGLNSCKKADNVPSQIDKTDEISIKDGRLVFAHQSSFKDLMQKAHEKKSTELINNIVSNLVGHQDFISLREEAIIFSKTGKLSSVSLKKSLKMTLSPGKIPLQSNIDLSPPAGPELEETPLDSLVQDPYFASMLNPQGEIEVENAIYKVTGYGTFISAPEDKPEVDDLVDQLNNGVLELNNIVTNEGGSFFKILGKFIRIYDTYGTISDQKDDKMNVQDYPVTYSSTYQYRPDTDAWIYDSLPTIQYGGKTWLGKVFESIRGRDEVFTDNFESKRRVRVTFYNSSWVVYSSVGISVQMQKKNWIGWSGTEANELRLGWDAMEYYCGDAPAPPSAPVSSTPQRFSKLDLPKLTKDYVEVDLLGYNFTFDKNENLQKGIKKIHEFLPRIPGLKPKTERNENYAYKVWSNRALNSISTILDRDEIVSYNTESINKTLDWSVGFKVSWGFEGPPSVGYAPLKFTVTRASVFGIAKYGSIWKGGRIIADK